MTNSQRLAAVRLRLQQWLLEQNGSNSDDSPPRAAPRIHKESILIRDGFYCGRQFEVNDYRAVWFMEEDELKISTREGKWVCSLRGDELVPAEVDLAEEATAADDPQPGVIPMPPAHPMPASPIAETDDDAESGGEQEIRRAA